MNDRERMNERMNEDRESMNIMYEKTEKKRDTLSLKYMTHVKIEKKLMILKDVTTSILEA